MFRDIKAVNFSLWLTLGLMSFIPLIYSTVRINFLGDMPNEWAFSIASQVMWLKVGYEVIHEALLIPLIFILGQCVSNKARFLNRLSVFVTLSC